MKRRKLTAENMYSAGGVQCPNCGCCHFITLRTERLSNMPKIRRSKVCRHCHTRIITLESFSHRRNGK